jgi:tRNA 2-thiouridine synthesizing protein A
MTGGEVLVDARGMLCPWPILRLSRAARALAGAGRIILLADDSATAGELAELCAQRGWKLEPHAKADGEFHVVVP